MNPATMAAQAAAPAIGGRFYRWYVLALLVLIFAVQYLDRQVVVILAEPLRREFGLTDSELGLLTGFVFSIPYSLMLIPIGMMVDRYNRRNILAVAAAIWSVMTVLTGLAGGLIQLVAIRSAIAAAESANNPTALSLLADLFDRGRRATVIGIFYAGPAIATVAGFATIAAVADAWGWRAAFLIAGIPGVILATLLLLTVREPLRERGDAGDEDAAPRLSATLRFMLASRTVRHLLVAMTLVATVNSGQIAWLSPLLMRVHGLSLVSAAAAISIAYGVFLTAGQMFGGAVVDRLARRDPLWVGRTTSLCMAAAATAMLCVIVAPSPQIAIALLPFWALPTGCLYGPVMGALQNLTPPRMRGVANALMAVLINLIGAGVGPLIAGSLSDALHPRFGDFAIGYALAALTLLGFWAAAHFFAMRYAYVADMRRVTDGG